MPLRTPFATVNFEARRGRFEEIADMEIYKHRTHTGEIISGERVRVARAKVADDWAAMAHAIRTEDAYASHVTADEKDANLRRELARADEIRSGDAGGFTIWQRINAELTGEWVPLFRH